MKKLFTLFVFAVSSLMSLHAEGNSAYREVFKKTVKADGSVSETVQTKYDEKGREDTIYTTSVVGLNVPGYPENNSTTQSMDVTCYNDMNQPIRIEHYEMMEGDWTMLGFTNQSDFDFYQRPCRFEGYERNEETGEMEKKTLIVVERYAEGFCILESVTYVWVDDDWQKVTQQTGSVDEFGNRSQTVISATTDLGGFSMKIDNKTSYEYYYEPVVCYKSIKMETYINGVLDEVNSLINTYEYKYGKEGLPTEQISYKNGEYFQTTYFTYEAIADDELILRDAAMTTKGVYNINGVYMGENLNNLPDGFYIIRTNQGAKKVLKTRK
ncbi:MAG: hypothetical protein KBT32_07455 [Bacteroidales bacterium]|nr:hypothetical protein [Candidatus Physcocola equi]